MSVITLVLVSAGLTVLAGAFAMADAALLTVSTARAAELARAGVRGAAALQKVSGEAARHTNVLLFSRLLCELTATAVVAVVALRATGSGWAAVAMTAAVMTLAAYLVVGLGPRTLGRRYAYPIGRAVAPAVLRVGRLVAVFSRRGGNEGRRAGEESERDQVTPEGERGENTATRSGQARAERDMVQSVVDLGETIAREVMVPRTDMVWVEAGHSVDQALELALSSGFSRLPVIGETVDDVLGVVYLKDLAQRSHSGEGGATVAQLMRTASFVPESKHVDDLLREMQVERTHIAIIIDEYGGTAGLVTIEDILEEIVGEITDEYDKLAPAPVEWLGDGQVRVSARLPVEDLGELFSIELATNEVETVGGLLAQALGRVPTSGSSAKVGELTLRAEASVGRRNRIESVVVSRRPAGVVDQRSDQHEQPQNAHAG